MIQAIKVLGQVQLGTSLTTIYEPPTAPPNLKAVVRGMWICNTDSVERTVTIRHGAGTLTAANSLFEDTPIEANNVYNVGSNEGFGMILGAGDKVQGLSDAASKITVTLFGEEIS